MITFSVGDALDFDSQFSGLQAIASDLPSGIKFMGSAWDGSHGGRDAWIRYWTARLAAGRRACERGSYGVFWALPRTTFFTGYALDDAGWEIVDVITHLFGQGRPKAAGAIKPASEHWYLVRNGGGGGLNIDACRVPRNWLERGESWLRSGYSAKPDARKIGGAPPGNGINANPLGSYPTNLVISHCEGCTETHHLAGCDCGNASVAMGVPGGDPSPCPSCGASRWWACPAADLDRQTGTLASGTTKAGAPRGSGGGYNGSFGAVPFKHDSGGDSGGASRYFPQFWYAAKSPSRERHGGCYDLFWEIDKNSLFGYRQISRADYVALPSTRRAMGNVHPTVKSIGSRERPGIARWMVRLITPIGGRVGDLTCGSGSIPIAAHRDGFDAVGMDICPEAIVISQHREVYFNANV